jgi:hydroxymethylpyrimidine pyrophosphatase-like HAD family hydrolase
MRLLGRIGDGSLSPVEVLAVGDSTTDLSLFKLFHDSVFILNPRPPIEESQVLQRVAKYVSEHPHGNGFTEVVLHVIDARACGD